MSHIFAENKLAFFVALCVGTIIIFPSFYFHYFDSHYQGVEFFGSDAEDGYLAQIQEIYDGNYRIGNPYLSDGKDRPFIQQPLSPIIVASLGKVVGMDARQINMTTKFFFPFLLFLVVYFLFLELTERKDISILCSLFILMIPATTSLLNPMAWVHLIKTSQFLSTDSQFLLYARPINPQISSLFVFGYLLMLLKYLRTRHHAWVVGILLGLSFYTYFFAFSFLVVSTFLMTLFRRDMWKILVIAGVISIPYFFNSIQAMQSPEYLDVIHRLGMVEARTFIFSRVWWGVLIILIMKKNLLKNSQKIFIFSLWLALLILSNQQVITGKILPVPSHYHWYYTAPIGGALIVWFISRNFGKFNYFLITSLIAFGILFQINSYNHQYNSIVSLQEYAPTITSLRKMPQGTVFASEDLMSLVPAYTYHDVYYMRYLGDYLVSQEKMKNILFFLIKSPRDIENKEDIGSRLFGQYYRMKNGCYGCYSDSITEQLKEEYRRFLLNPIIYKIDYTNESL